MGTSKPGDPFSFCFSELHLQPRSLNKPIAVYLHSVEADLEIRSAGRRLFSSPYISAIEALLAMHNWLRDRRDENFAFICIDHDEPLWEFIWLEDKRLRFHSDFTEDAVDAELDFADLLAAQRRATLELQQRCHELWGVDISSMFLWKILRYSPAAPVSSKLREIDLPI